MKRKTPPPPPPTFALTRLLLVLPLLAFGAEGCATDPGEPSPEQLAEIAQAIHPHPLKICTAVAECQAHQCNTVTCDYPPGCGNNCIFKICQWTAANEGAICTPPPGSVEEQCQDGHRCDDGDCKGGPANENAPCNDSNECTCGTTCSGGDCKPTGICIPPSLVCAMDGDICWPACGCCDADEVCGQGATGGPACVPFGL